MANAWVVALIAASLSGALWGVVDIDGDGASSFAELGGSSPWRPDGDDDGLPDGYEAREGRRIAEAPDGDSDGDGVLDGDETTTDCDRDGAPAFFDADDDGDGLIDGRDPDACNSDSDGDGVLDGSEQHIACVLQADCDEDGLADGAEPAGFSPLLGDSWGASIGDAAMAAMLAHGYPPGPDADRDGVPDTWEGVAGILDWTGFTPAPGQRDLLMRWIVWEPPTDTHPPVNLERVKQDVIDFYAGAGYAPQIHELRMGRSDGLPIDLAFEEERNRTAALVADVPGIDNPFVYNVLIVPSRLQPKHGESTGVAINDGMMAIIDYGANYEITWTTPEGSPLRLKDDEVSLRPSYEPHIQNGRPTVLKLFGFSTARYNEDDDHYRLFFDSEVEDNPLDPPRDVWLSWYGPWMDSPVVARSGAAEVTLEFLREGLREERVAQSIVHEVGHMFGLCHIHAVECYSKYPGGSDLVHDDSAMSYGADRTKLQYLPEEWELVDATHACGQRQHVLLLAAGEPMLPALFVDTSLVAAPADTCDDAPPLPQSLRPFEEPAAERHYPLPPPAAVPIVATAGWGLVVLAIAAAPVWLPRLRALREGPVRPGGP